MKHFTAACVQLTSGPEHLPNIKAASDLIREAHARGALFIQTPENTSMMEPDKERMLAKAFVESDHPAVTAFSELAAKLGLWLHIGSLTVALDNETRAANRGYLFGPDGKIQARYDKIHMFDVEIPDGQSYRESMTFKPGQEAVVESLPWCKIGLAICYDIRFPKLFRAQAQSGAKVLTAPAAFTRFTGESHWHVLQRARAIETGCYMISAAQCGTHAEGRQTYGHSLIVAPWGEVLADGGTEPGVVMADIDLAKVAQARSMVPAIANDRNFTFREK